MPFREKSAWAMGALMIAAGLYYLRITLGASQSPGGILVGYTVIVVAGAIAVQVVLAIASPKEASAPADERERLVIQRAGHWSGTLLAAGAVASLLGFLAHRDGNLLFHSVMASLIGSQIAEYALQVVMLRRGL